MSHPKKNLLLITLYALVGLYSVTAGAAVDTCLVVQVDKNIGSKGFHKLVATEVAKHPTHKIVKTNCDTHLFVDFFGAAGTRQLTIRTDNEVPIRFTITNPTGLPKKLEEGISLALGNNPVYLQEDIAKYSKTKRALHSVVQQGQNIYRLELFQSGIRTGEGASFSPGAAFAVTRGSASWRVLGRVYGQGFPSFKTPSQAVLELAVGMDVGVTYEFNQLRNVSPYLSLGAGLQFLRFSGPLSSGEIDQINKIGPTVYCRLGIRMFRLFDFDFDLFVLGYLPLFSTKQTDSLLFDENDDNGRYTPSFQLGVGVGF